MCIPGVLPFLEHRGSEVALLQHHLQVLRRQRDLCDGELKLRLEQEFPRLLQGRSVRIDRLHAAAAQSPRGAHLLRGRAYSQQVLLAQDTALFNKVAAAQRIVPVPVDRMPAAATASPPPASEELFTLLEQAQGRADVARSDTRSSAGSNDADSLAGDGADVHELEYEEDVDIQGLVGHVAPVTSANELAGLTVDLDHHLAEPARLPAGQWLPSSRREGISVQTAFDLDSDEKSAQEVVCTVACQGLGVRLRALSFATLAPGEWLDSDVIAATSILTQVCHASAAVDLGA